MTLTRISKVLAVFIAVGSIAFVGFAIATTFGEPDPLQALSDPAFNGYAISKQVGGQLWEAKRGIDQSSVGTSKVVHEVMVKVLNEVDQNNKQEIQLLQQRQAALQAHVDELLAVNPADTKALEAFEAQNRAYLAQIRADEATTTTAVISATAESQKKEQEVARRREDVFRLKQQVEELKTDLFRLQEIALRLESLNVQIQGDVQQSLDRNAQLKTRLGY